MATQAEKAKIREMAKAMYIDGNRDLRALATRIDVPFKTVWRWAHDGNWEALAKDESMLEQQIKRAARVALLAGLESYAKKPQDADLKNLTQLLKDYNQKNEPSKELNNYIILFLDQVITYFHEKGLDELANRVQEHIHDLADWFRVKNNG